MKRAISRALWEFCKQCKKDRFFSWDPLGYFCSVCGAKLEK